MGTGGKLIRETALSMFAERVGQLYPGRFRPVSSVPCHEETRIEPWSTGRSEKGSTRGVCFARLTGPRDPFYRCCHGGKGTSGLPGTFRGGSDKGCPVNYSSSYGLWALGEVGRLQEASKDLGRAIALAEDESVPPDTLWFCLVLDGYASTRFGARPESAERARRGLRIAESLGSPFYIQMAHFASAAVASTLGDWEASRVHFENTLEAALSSGGKAWNEASVYAGLADAHRELGNLDEAKAAAARGIQIGQRDGLRPAECRSQVALARVLIAQGGSESGSIDAALVRAQALIEESGAHSYAPSIAEAWAELASVNSDAEGARSAYAEAHRLFHEMGANGHAERLKALIENLPS
jgi:tetratricopeptide (TPR) repeat protein